MRICIVGVGGVGGYFGARLAAAGSDVLFAARGAQREAMARDGLRVRSPLGDVHIPKPHLLAEPAAEPPCDIILFCVKLWDTEAALDPVVPLLTEQGAVISLQNGVSAEAVIAARVGRDRVMGGLAQISARIVAPGVIEQTGSFARIQFGELDGHRSARGEALLAACTAAGVEATLSDDIVRDIWRKFVFLAPLAGVCARHRLPIGAIRGDPARRRDLEALVAETAAVGRAEGVALPADLERRILDSLDKLPAEMKPSMLHDLEAGRRLELDWLNGEIVRRGAALGIATPANAAVVAALALYADGRPREAETAPQNSVTVTDFPATDFR